MQWSRSSTNLFVCHRVPHFGAIQSEKAASNHQSASQTFTGLKTMVHELTMSILVELHRDNCVCTVASSVFRGLQVGHKKSTRLTASEFFLFARLENNWLDKTNKCNRVLLQLLQSLLFLVIWLSTILLLWVQTWVVFCQTTIDVWHVVNCLLPILRMHWVFVCVSWYFEGSCDCQMWFLLTNEALFCWMFQTVLNSKTTFVQVFSFLLFVCLHSTQPVFIAYVVCAVRGHTHSSKWSSVSSRRWRHESTRASTRGGIVLFGRNTWWISAFLLFFL